MTTLLEQHKRQSIRMSRTGCDSWCDALFRSRDATKKAISSACSALRRGSQ